MLRIGRINAHLGIFITAAFFVAAGCQGSVTTIENNPSTNDSLLEGEGDDTPDACTSGALGDGVTCQTPDVWKTQGWEACKAQGLSLTDLQFDSDCADGTSTHASYACCPEQPPPESDPNSCDVQTLGDGVTCRSGEDWKSMFDGSGTDVCAAEGRVVHDLNPAFDCDNYGSTWVKVTCCDNPPPPDPDPNQKVCASGGLGDGTTCKTQAEYEAEIDAVCSPKGLTVVDAGYANDCGDGTSTYAKFVCCQP